MAIGKACRICGRRFTGGTGARCQDCERQSYRHPTACKVCGKVGPFPYCEEHYQEMIAAREATYAEKVARQPWRKRYSDPEYHRNRALARRRARGSCERCGRSDLPLECDHIVPLSSGGTNDLANLWMLCTMCHYGKSAAGRRRR